MRRAIISIIFLFMALTSYAQTPSIDGTWIAPKDKEGRIPVIVLYSKAGEVLGYPIGFYNIDEVAISSRYKPAKNLRGTIFIYGLRYDGEKFSGGRIYDHSSGKSYNLTITPSADCKKIEVRASKDKIGIFGKSFEWELINDERFKPLPDEEIKIYPSYE